MKYVMTGALIAAAMLAAPAGHADPDPHKPDLGANFCPGGATPPPQASCDGVPYADGSYWHSTSPMANYVVVQCVVPPPAPGIFGGLVPQPTAPVPAPPGSCQ